MDHTNVRGTDLIQDVCVIIQPGEMNLGKIVCKIDRNNFRKEKDPKTEVG